MPLYDYECRRCGHRFELRQSFHDDPVSDCPSCSAEGEVQRIIAPVGIVFKGGGYYVTDTRKARQHRREAPAESETASSDAAAGGGGTDGSSDGGAGSGSGASEAPAVEKPKSAGEPSASSGGAKAEGG